jgi:Protein of unknown function (DUF3435)
MAEREPVHQDYQMLKRTLDSTIRAEERASLTRVQEECDAAALVIDIQRQLKGQHCEDDEDCDDTSGSVTTQPKLFGRRRIAEASLCDPSTFTAEKGFRRHADLCTDMIALCKRGERRHPRTSDSQGRPSVKTADDETIMPNSEPTGTSLVPLKCTPF